MSIEGLKLMSKTQHYRKVTKPLLERKRRARMNFYLEELKNLIVDTIESQGKHVTKFEKADILEMTVQYLRSKKQTKQDHVEQIIDPEKFQAGFSQAAYDVSKVFVSFPDQDLKFGTKLVKHLGYQLKYMKAGLNKTYGFAYSGVEFQDINFAKVNPSERPENPQESEVWRPW